MGKIKRILAVFFIILTIWYTFDFFRYSSYEDKKVIMDINGSTLILGDIHIEPDASYMPVQMELTDSLKITGFGLLSLFIKEQSDLTKNQKVRIWFSDSGSIKKMVVSYFFECLIVNILNEKRIYDERILY